METDVPEFLEPYRRESVIVSAKVYIFKSKSIFTKIVSK